MNMERESLKHFDEEEDNLARCTKKFKDSHQVEGAKGDKTHAKIGSYRDKLVGYIPGAFERAFGFDSDMQEDVESDNEDELAQDGNLRVCFSREKKLINLDKTLVKTIFLKKLKQVIQYEGIGTLCFECGRIRHNREVFPFLVRENGKSTQEGQGSGSHDEQRDRCRKIYNGEDVECVGVNLEFVVKVCNGQPSCSATSTTKLDLVRDTFRGATLGKITDRDRERKDDYGDFSEEDSHRQACGMLYDGESEHGTVWHERRRPVRHSFQYPVRYALYNLDHAPPDHLSADQARQIASTNGQVLLLTIPPSVGYVQNPLSVYYCYDVEAEAQASAPTQLLKKCIAEVTNTPWGERVTFVFNPNSDLVAKSLHVSPFMDMLGNWNMRANAPGDNLYVTISVQHPKLGDYFTAVLKAKRVPSSLVSDHAMFFWLMPHKVAVWIYWHDFHFFPPFSNLGKRQATGKLFLAI
nr:hypothetical protein CFP56_33344 [Quercus suber]